MHLRILIIATTPYSENYSSRAMDAEFHFWEKENIAQIFTRNIVPTKGHCGELFQISDSKLLKRWLHRIKETGTLYLYDELTDSGLNQIIDDSLMQKFGTKHTPTIEILRRMLWKKKYWCTDQLNEWMDKFKPDCIFYNFSNHIFTQQIALYAAERYEIPIITAIGDDFYFNDQKSISPSYHLYRSIFKRLTREILTRKNSSAVYCSDKIRDKYNSEFGLEGETVYLSSTIPRKPFRCINQEKPVIAYFGNIRLGRNNSLLDVATALGHINSDYRLEVYSGESDPAYYRVLKEHPNVLYRGRVPYSQVQKRTEESDVVVVVEGFQPENLDFTRYSLSTKAADSLASGAAVFAYGPEEAGVIGYLISTQATVSCTDKNKLEDCLRTLITDIDLQKKIYEQASSVFQKNHTFESSGSVFENIVEKATMKRMIKESKEVSNSK